MFRRLTLSIVVALMAVACSSGESTDAAEERLLALLDDPATLDVPGAPEDSSWPPEVVEQVVADLDSVGTETALRLADSWCDSTKGYESGEQWVLDIADARAAGESGPEVFGELMALAGNYSFMILALAIPQAEYCDSPTQNRIVAESVTAITNLGQAVPSG
jgi:hypothetical protein